MNPQINSFLTKFNTGLNNCRIFETSGNLHPAIQQMKSKKGKESVIIGRGVEEKEMKFFKEDHKKALDPLPIMKGGSFKFLIRLSVVGSGAPLSLESYSFRFIGLAKSKNNIHSLRFDRDMNTSMRQTDWDDDLKDAPSHPAHHLHINFEDDNELRVPTGPIDPLMIIQNIDYWYSQRLFE